MRLIEKLAQRDAEWRDMALYITKDKERADDLVQEFYIKMDKKDGKVKLEERYDDYIFIILKNLNYDLNIKDKNNSRGERKQIHLDDEYIPEYITEKVEDENVGATTRLYNKECFEEMYENIEGYLEQGYKDNNTMQYKVGLLKLNALEGMSMQKIADSTGITKRSIQLSIEGVRKQIREEFQEKYNKYKTDLENE
jgi:RNA polymerase sigma factor (sigma-70 family)